MTAYKARCIWKLLLLFYPKSPSKLPHKDRNLPWVLWGLGWEALEVMHLGPLAFHNHFISRTLGIFSHTFEVSQEALLIYYQFWRRVSLKIASGTPYIEGRENIWYTRLILSFSQRISAAWNRVLSKTNPLAVPFSCRFRQNLKHHKNEQQKNQSKHWLVDLFTVQNLALLSTQWENKGGNTLIRGKRKDTTFSPVI